MIENSPIVNDTRKIRCSISDRFDNDVDSYIDYLLSRKNQTAVVAKTEKDAQNETLADYLADHIGVISSSEHIPGGAQMSKDCGKKFAEGLLRKRESL
jgi:hypothetical protein